jgi:hypothetical protein
VPAIWVAGGELRWPRSKLSRARDTCEEPREDWLSFPVVKIKVPGISTLTCLDLYNPLRTALYPY